MGKQRLCAYTRGAADGIVDDFDRRSDTNFYFDLVQITVNNFRDGRMDKQVIES